MRATQRMQRQLRFYVASLASRTCCSENVCIFPLVVVELKLRNARRHVFLADLVEGSDHAALQDRPEAFDGVGVSRANNVFMRGVVDNGVREISAQKPIAGMVVGAPHQMA